MKVSKKFTIREAWLLDESGNKSLKLKEIDPNEVFEVHANIESVRGGFGTISNDSGKFN